MQTSRVRPSRAYVELVVAETVVVVVVAVVPCSCGLGAMANCGTAVQQSSRKRRRGSRLEGMLRVWPQ